MEVPKQESEISGASSSHLAAEVANLKAKHAQENFKKVAFARTISFHQ